MIYLRAGDVGKNQRYGNYVVGGVYVPFLLLKKALEKCKERAQKRHQQNETQSLPWRTFQSCSLVKADNHGR